MDKNMGYMSKQISFDENLALVSKGVFQKCV